MRPLRINPVMAVLATRMLLESQQAQDQADQRNNNTPTHKDGRHAHNGTGNTGASGGRPDRPLNRSLP